MPARICSHGTGAPLASRIASSFTLTRPSAVRIASKSNPIWDSGIWLSGIWLRGIWLSGIWLSGASINSIWSMPVDWTLPDVLS